MTKPQLIRLRILTIYILTNAISIGVAGYIPHKHLWFWYMFCITIGFFINRANFKKEI